MSTPESQTYPAAFTVHTAQGPVPACVKHSRQLIGLGRILGMHYTATGVNEGDQCTNCINEALAAQVKAAVNKGTSQ